MASNIANADTRATRPAIIGFSRLARGDGRPPTAGQMADTTARAMSLAGARADSQKNYALQAQTNLDSNGVDMDRERASLPTTP